jgi:hypothetical protein
MMLRGIKGLTSVDAPILRIDERVIDSWRGIHEVIGDTFEVSLDQKEKAPTKVTVKEKKEGILVLTNQRLLFLEGQEPDGKRLGESVRVSLIDVDKVWFEKAPIKYVEEVKGLETHIFSLKKVGTKKEFKAFKKLLEEHCQKRKEQLEKETKKVVRFKVS